MAGATWPYDSFTWKSWKQHFHQEGNEASSIQFQLHIWFEATKGEKWHLVKQTDWLILSASRCGVQLGNNGRACFAGSEIIRVPLDTSIVEHRAYFMRGIRTIYHYITSCAHAGSRNTLALPSNQRSHASIQHIRNHQESEEKTHPSGLRKGSLWYIAESWRVKITTMPARFVADTHVFYRIDHLVGAARGKKTPGFKMIALITLWWTNIAMENGYL